MILVLGFSIGFDHWLMPEEYLLNKFPNDVICGEVSCVLRGTGLFNRNQEGGEAFQDEVGRDTAGIQSRK